MRRWGLKAPPSHHPIALLSEIGHEGIEVIIRAQKSKVLSERTWTDRMCECEGVGIAAQIYEVGMW